MQIENTNYIYNAGEQKTEREQELGKDAFLKILSAQLQHQDPMAGGDNSEYIAQMAQFSSLEQMENLNKSFTQMMKSQEVLLASNMIGKEVAIYDGENGITGVIKGFNITSDGPSFSINGQEYSIEDIYQVAQFESEETVEATDETVESSVEEETSESETNEGTQESTES